MKWCLNVQASCSTNTDGECCKIKLAVECKEVLSDADEGISQNQTRGRM